MGELAQKLSELVDGSGQPFERNGERNEEGFALPHVITFASIMNQASKVYSWRWDEAYKDNRNNALAMRRDAWLMGLLGERAMPTAQMSWHLEPDDAGSYDQKSCCEYLTKLIEKTPFMQRYKMCLLQALWYGRYAVQSAWHWTNLEGKRTFLVRDHRPVNGDKIQFRYRLNDDSGEVEDGDPCLLVNTAFAGRLPAHDVVYTDKGKALLLASDYWRERFAIHKHEVDDADYFEGEMAGAVHGIGIRSRIYWIDWLRREFISWISDYMERVGQGLTVFYYEAGNPKAEQEALAAAKKYGRNTIMVMPRPIGSEKQGNAIERVEVPTAGSQFLLGMVKYFDDIERYYIVGQTLSSGDGPTGLGSGLAEAHLDTKFRIIKYDCTNLEETLTTDFVGVLKKWNAPQAQFNVRWKFDIDRPNPKEKLDAAKVVFDMGGALDEAEVRSFAGLTTPKAGEPVLQQQQQAVAPGMGAQMGGAVPPGGLNDQLKRFAGTNGNGDGGGLNDQLKALAHGSANGNGDGGLNDQLKALAHSDGNGQAGNLNEQLKSLATSLEAPHPDIQRILAEHATTYEKNSDEVRSYGALENWITIGAKGPGEDGKKHGGSPVLLDGDKIVKGHASLTGKTISGLKKSPEAPPAEQPKGKPDLHQQHKLIQGHVDKVWEHLKSSKTGSINEGLLRQKYKQARAAAQTIATEIMAPPPAPPQPAPPPAKTEPSAPDYVGKSITMGIGSTAYKPTPEIDALAEKAKTSATDKQAKAVKEYSNLEYAQINTAMRNCPPTYKCVKGDIKTMMDDIEAVIANVPAFEKPLTVYRGIKLRDQTALDKLLKSFEKSQKTGKPVTMPSLTSTSLNPKVATNFADTTNRVVFHVQAKQGLLMEKMTAMPGENELLMSGKAKYKVVGLKKDVEFYTQWPDGERKLEEKHHVVYLEQV